ncbi:MAG: bifunctional methylenetetrahydrofolate dehydrogenase/methenyltetrahydrofolate cyclohydrolase FolD [Candidatus Micrarchaeia archaeon]
MIIDGKALSERILEEVKNEAFMLKRKPQLAVVLVGDDPASRTYVKNKEKACERIGVLHKTIELPADVSEEEVVSVISHLNGDEKIDGILVQLPLPEHINEEKVITSINPSKDVDGIHPINLGRLLRGEEGVKPCTPRGIIALLDSINYEIQGKNAVVVGRSNIVGKPVSLMLLARNATVTVCHSKTRNLEAHTRNADILVAAVGKPKFITADMVKSGAVVIDVGINRLEGKLVGDVDFEAVKEKAYAITPVPGGVGPMTVAMLMRNLVELARARG